MDKRVTIYDIAKRLGISTATVNRALTGKPKVNEDTRALVVKTAQQMGFRPNSLARAIARRQMRLAVVAFTSFPEFHGEYIAGCKQAGEELRDYNVQIDYFSYDGGASNTPESDVFLNDTLMNIANSGYDGALVCARFTAAFNVLREKGVAVATAINDIDVEYRRFCVRYNGFVAGRMAAELIWRLARRERPVAIASCDMTRNGIHSEIVEGFKSQLQYTPLDLKSVYYHYDDDEQAYAKTNRLIDEIDDIAAIYVNSFCSTGVIRAIVERRRNDIVLVTSDISRSLRENLASGVVSASIFQNQRLQGEMGLKLLYRSIADGENVEDRILIKPEIILASNMDLY
ncbi:MAG: LacI family DNA-binding transcriptional regulator [Clostridia bacterium]|nr:LacI family DNA-binding transcriptional regulator [Clostridia bacterium]